MPYLQINNTNKMKYISCSVDGDKLLKCIADNNDIYFPFNKFLKRRFDLSGKYRKGFIFL